MDLLTIIRDTEPCLRETLVSKGTYSVTQTIIFDQSDCIIRGQGQVTITMLIIFNDNNCCKRCKSTVGVANDVSPVERVLIENITLTLIIIVEPQTRVDNHLLMMRRRKVLCCCQYITMRNLNFLNGWLIVWIFLHQSKLVLVL